MDEYNKARRELEHAHANLNYMLHLFGDELAEKHGYDNINGIEAVYLYLVQKYNWLPSVVRAMHPDDIRLCLNVEMKGWKVPANG